MGVRNPTPHVIFGGGSARLVIWVHMRLVASLHFFSFFLFLLSSSRAGIAILDRSGRSIRQSRVFSQPCTFWGLANIRLHLGGSPKICRKWAGIGILQPNRRSLKYIGHRWKYFTDTLITGTLSNTSKVRQMGSWRGHVAYF